MIHDEESYVKELGWRKIIKIRDLQCTADRVRAFKIPTLNFDASTYYSMGDWNDNVSEPPLIKHIQSADIRQYISSKEFPALTNKYDGIPCHTQSVERHIKLFTSVSSRFCSAENRDGAIRTTFESREKIPSFESKSQFNI